MIGKEINIKTYENFIKKVYKDESTIANKINLIKLVTSKDFRANSFQKLIGVYENDSLLCVSLAIIHKNKVEQITLGFFEALPQEYKAVSILIQYCMDLGQKKGTTTMVIGMEGHCNNGLGFSLDEKSSSFGETKTPLYYEDYFKEFKKINLLSFQENTENIRVKLTKDMQILEGKNDIQLEYADFSLRGFKETIKRYTELNNKIFISHRYYFKREYQEDYQLFRQMLPLLKKENLIFAKIGNIDIGFILWYPDFNELSQKNGVGLGTVIKYKLLRQKILKAKVVEIGVLSKFQNQGAAVILLDKALSCIKKGTKNIISSWILESNKSSVLITKRYCPNLYKRYCYYEKRI